MEKRKKRFINIIAIIGVIIWAIGFISIWNVFFGWVYQMSEMSNLIKMLFGFLILTAIIAALFNGNKWLIFEGVISLLGGFNSLNILNNIGIYIYIIGSFIMIVAGIYGIIKVKKINSTGVGR